MTNRPAQRRQEGCPEAEGFTEPAAALVLLLSWGLPLTCTIHGCADFWQNEAKFVNKIKLPVPKVWKQMFWATGRPPEVPHKNVKGRVLGFWNRGRRDGFCDALLRPPVFALPGRYSPDLESLMLRRDTGSN
jgi:hypothetical protein